jgi:malyl-CoA/(S)-citramalyl-CoA lyase
MDKARLHRSELAVPGTNLRAMEKAPGLGADVVFLDLEDAVAPDDKDRARQQAIDALLAHDWSACSVSVRINALDTHRCYRDVVRVVEEGGGVLDTVLVPKVGRPSDVEFVSTLLDQIEVARGFEPGRIGIHVLIETAAGMANVESIAGARPDRLEAMVFGVADYAASVQARTTNIGGLNPDYPGDQWHFGISRMVAACRAHALRPIDGPFGDIEDAEGYRAAALRRARLRGQVGDPSVPDRARERGLHAVGRGGRARPADPPGDGGRGEAGQGRDVARRPPDRCRVEPDGGEPDAQGRTDPDARLSPRTIG